MTGSAEAEFDVDFKAVAGKSYLVASPSVGMVNPSAVRALRVALMHTSNYGAKWVGDASSGRGSVMSARNFAVDSAFEAVAAELPLEGVFWVDDDILLPPEALTMLAASGQDFVTGVYCQRADDMFPLVGQYITQGEKHGFRWAVSLPENALLMADGCGFGIVYTSWRMLEKLGKGCFEHRSGVSEDLSFCLRAKEAGFQLYCLTAIKCAHLGEPNVITYAGFRDKWLRDHADDETEMVRADGASAA